jgi:hypothetical protein
MGGSLTHKLICEECNKVIDRTIDDPFMNSILPELPSEFNTRLNKKGVTSSVCVERQLSFNFAQQMDMSSKQIIARVNPTRGFEANHLALEGIKVTYTLAALEFGEAYVMKSPVAEKLRKAICEGKHDEISFKPDVDLGPLNSMLSGQDTLCILLFQNACILSMFGTTSTVEYCLADESFFRTIDNAVLYAFDPDRQSYSRHLLANYLVTQVRP